MGRRAKMGRIPRFVVNIRFTPRGSPGRCRDIRFAEMTLFAPSIFETVRDAGQWSMSGSQQLLLFDGDLVSLQSFGPGDIEVRSTDDGLSTWQHEGGGAAWHERASAHSFLEGVQVEAVIGAAKPSSAKQAADRQHPAGKVGEPGGVEQTKRVSGAALRKPEIDPESPGVLVIDIAKRIRNVRIASSPEAGGTHRIVGMNLFGLVLAGTDGITEVRNTTARDVKIIPGARADFDNLSFESLPRDVQENIRPFITVDGETFQSVGTDGLTERFQPEL